MLSIVICSRYSDIPAEIRDNLLTTTNGRCEIVVIDNSRNEWNIFSAYNEGVRRSKGDAVCFMHEDVTVHSMDWDKKVENTFKKYPRLGLLGIIGEKAMSNRPVYFENMPVFKYLQTIKGINGREEPVLVYKNTSYYDNAGLADVVAVDGVFMCMPRDIFDKVSFDEKSFDGFHGYDIDISMQVIAAGFAIKVTSGILVCHHNDVSASYNAAFLPALNKVYAHWTGRRLPVVKIDTLAQLRSLSRLEDDYRAGLPVGLHRIIYVILKYWYKR